jgi:hypothetical protein
VWSKSKIDSQRSKVAADVECIAAPKFGLYQEDTMRKITARQTISAIVALPILLMANTTQAFATDTGQKIDPIKKVSDLGDELDVDIGPPTTISIEESEDWDEPDFTATLDMEISKFMTNNLQAVIDEPPPVVYLSAARGQSTRECRISGICE